MADTDPFPTIHGVVINDSGPIRAYTFTEAAKAGMVVGFAATGVSNAVVPMDATGGEQPIGVAVYDVEAGDMGAVAMNGNEVIVCNGEAGVIDSGDHVETNNASVQGTVSPLALEVYTANHYVVGIALEDIGANATGKILVQVGVQLDQTA